MQDEETLAVSTIRVDRTKVLAFTKVGDMLLMLNNTIGTDNLYVLLSIGHNKSQQLSLGEANSNISLALSFIRKGRSVSIKSYEDYVCVSLPYNYSNKLYLYKLVKENNQYRLKEINITFKHKYEFTSSIGFDKGILMAKAYSKAQYSQNKIPRLLRISFNEYYAHEMEYVKPIPMELDNDLCMDISDIHTMVANDFVYYGTLDNLNKLFKVPDDYFKNMKIVGNAIYYINKDNKLVRIKHSKQKTYSNKISGYFVDSKSVVLY